MYCNYSIVLLLQSALKAAQAKVSALENAAQSASKEGSAAAQEAQRLQSALNYSRQQSSELATQVYLQLVPALGLGQHEIWVNHELFKVHATDVCPLFCKPSLWSP